MKIKNRQQWLAVVAIAIVGLFAADKLVLTPLTATWKQRAKRIVEMRKQVEAGRQLLQREGSLLSRWAQMRTNTLPNDRPLAEEQVLKAFDRWAQASRVSLTAISPQWKTDTEDYMTLECRVDAAGSLSAITRFLYDIERDPMALKLQAVELSTRDNDGAQLTLGLQLSGLVLTSRENRL